MSRKCSSTSSTWVFQFSRVPRHRSPLQAAGGERGNIWLVTQTSNEKTFSSAGRELLYPTVFKKQLFVVGLMRVGARRYSGCQQAHVFVAVGSWKVMNAKLQQKLRNEKAVLQHETVIVPMFTSGISDFATISTSCNSFATGN